MTIETLPSSDAVAARAAELIACHARKAVSARGVFTFAVSGGRTPWQMLRELATQDVPWASVHVFQVDERIAPAGDPDRNLTHLRASLLSHAPIPESQIHAMPVNDPDARAGAAAYARTLESLCGVPPILDLAHLGLGPDGHTASLIPGDAVLHEQSLDVALTGLYQNRHRMTLTYPVLNRARHVLWVVTGAEKAPMVPRLLAGDPTIPAGALRPTEATLLMDAEAAG